MSQLKKMTESDKTTLLLFSWLPYGLASRLVHVVSLLSSTLTLSALPAPPTSDRRGCSLPLVTSVYLSSTSHYWRAT
jgi:hypothetical protein